MTISLEEECRKPTKKRIVFVNRFYWPDESATSLLLTDLAEHLALDDSNVIIVTSRLRYTSSGDLLSRGEHRKGVNIHRVWTTGFNRRSIAGRMLDFLTFYVFSAVALLRLVRPGDVVVAKTDPPLIQVTAWIVTRIKRAHLINWCQDLFPEIALVLSKGRGSGVWGSVLLRLRNLALKRSEANVTISNEMRRTLLSQGIAKERTHVIRNWPNQAIKPVPKHINALRKAWCMEDNFVIGYSGNLGRAHLPDRVHTLVDELAGFSRLTFLFIGSGHGMTWLRRQCHQQGHQHAVFKPYQPSTSLSASLSVPDVHLISLKNGCQRFLSPSKFYGVLAAGRPVIFLGDANSELAELIHGLEVGIILSPDDVQAWPDLVSDLIHDDDRRARMGINAREACLDQFSPRRSLAAWQHVINGTPATVDSGMLGESQIQFPVETTN